MASNTGLAILGAGIWVREAYLPALAKLNDTAPVLKAVYSRSRQGAQALAKTAETALAAQEAPAVYHDEDAANSLDALLRRDDISAVVIAMPITHQPSLILKALEHGKHVLSEKPIAPDVAQGLELVRRYNAEYKPKGIVWRVAENFEAEPAILLAADAIASGSIGNIQFFRVAAVNHVSKDNKWYKTPWRTIPDYQGGFLLDGGVHTVAVLRTILPKPLTHLSGFASLNKDYLKPHDTINAIAKAGDDFHGVIEMTWAFPTEDKPDGDHFIVTGSRGWLAIKIIYGSPATVQVTITTSSPEQQEQNQAITEVIVREMQGVEAELRDFFKPIVGSGNSDGVSRRLGDPEGALRDVAVIQAALSSGGHLVDLAKLQKETSV